MLLLLLQFHEAAFDESNRGRSDVCRHQDKTPSYLLRSSFPDSDIRAIPTTNLSPALHLVRARLNPWTLRFNPPRSLRLPLSSPIEGGDPRSITLGVRGGINIMKTKDSGQRGEIWRVPERERERGGEEDE